MTEPVIASPPIFRSAGRAIRRWLHRLQPYSAILMYHRVAQVSSDPWELCVTPQHFAEHLQVLRRTATVVPLREILAPAPGRRTRRTVAITFDDGYADNLTAAKPLLKKYGFPATFFLATGALGKPREFWWDELEARLLSPGLLPHCLELSVNGITRKWDLGAETCYSSDAWEHHRHWRARNPPTTVRQRVYYELWEWLRQLPPNSQERILDQLADWSGSTRGARSTHRPLSLEEAGILGSHPHFDLGAHTVNHVVLPAHPASVQQEEIRASKSVTESIAKRPVVCFAYPYGDHSPETVEIVRRTGFASAVTTRAVCLNRHSNPWQLPRFNITDSDGAEFAHRLSRSCQPK